MKTISLKKVAVVAVASLGFGLLSVVPAQAAGFAAATVVATTSASTTTPAVGATVTITPSVTFASQVTATAPVKLTLVVTGPSDDATPTIASSVTGNLLPAAGATGYTVATADTATTLTIDVGSGTPAAVTTATAAGSFTFVPAKAGIYSAVVTPSGAGTNTASAALLIYVGYDAGGTTNVKRAFPTQGSNVTTGWAATAGGQATVRITGLPAATAGTYYVTTDTGAILAGTERDTGGDISGATSTTVSLTNGVNLGGGFNFTIDGAVAASAAMDVVITDTGSPATTTVKVVTYAAGTGAATTFVTATVTWGVAAAPSAQYSTLGLNLLAGTAILTAANDTTSVVASKTAGTKAFTIQAQVFDQYNVAYSAYLGASITGPGTLGINTTNAGGASTGRSISNAALATIGSVAVWSDGTAGTSVITVTATTAAGATTVLGSKTVYFAGSATKATATQNLYVAAAGSALGLATPTTTVAAATSFATTPAFSVSLTDATGVAPIAGATVKMTSSDATVITVGTCAELTAGTAAQIAVGTFECSVSGATGAASGKTATVTFSVLTAATGLYDVLAAPLTFTIGGAISKVVVATDKATYDAGAAVNLTATATDSSGNKAYDGQAPYASIASNKTFGGALPATTVYIVNGKKSTTSSTGTASLFAPATAGSFTISGLSAATAAAPAGTAYAATASVTDANAALVTMIDALNAKIVALNALIAKIMKKLGVK